MRNATLIALLALAGLAAIPAEAGSPPKLIVTPRIQPQVIDSTVLASRKINILRMRVIGTLPTPTTPPSPSSPSGPIPGLTP